MMVETKHMKLGNNLHTSMSSYVKIWHGDVLVSRKIA